MKTTAQETADAIRFWVQEINTLLQTANDEGIKVTINQKFNDVINAANGLPPNAPLELTITQTITLC